MANIVDGQTFGPFVIISKLGQGGMASVYRAYEPKLDRTVALKVLPEALLAQAGFVERFRREARVIARLEHPHIVPVYSSDIDEGQPWMALRLVRGGNLAERMEGAGLDRESGLRFLANVADALDFAHAQGIVHRDLKPQNILLGERGECYIADFGIASLLEGSTKLTQTGEAPGTAPYMAPEQALGQKVGPAADRYALGIIAYEWLAGVLPFDADTPFAVMYKHVTVPLPIEPLRALPERARDVLVRALAKQPADRWSSAGELVRALALALDSRGAGEASAAPAGSTAAPPVSIEQPGSRPPKPPRAPDAATSGGPAQTAPAQQSRPLPVGRLAAVATGLLAVGLAGWGVQTEWSTSSAPTSTSQAPALAPAPVPAPGERFRDCATCPEMVVIPAGSFQQGSPAGEAGREADEGPLRTVQVAAFALGRYELTRGEFRRFVEATGHRSDAERNTPVAGGAAEGCYSYKGGTEFGWRAGSQWRDPGFTQDDRHPVLCVSWNDARAYVGWLAKETGQAYRLPSESELEYANRAGSTAPWPWGGNGEAGCTRANYADATAQARFTGWTTAACSDGQLFTAPVGSYSANAFALYDTAGNVWEWAEDCWHDGYAGAPADGSAWTSGGDCGRRVLRGGSWALDPPWLRSALRLRGAAAHRGDDVGFRLARTL